jgi:hypothetical protein
MEIMGITWLGKNKLMQKFFLKVKLIEVIVIINYINKILRFILSFYKFLEKERFKKIIFSPIH